MVTESNMKRTLRFESELLIGPNEVVVEIGQGHVAKWALEVALLVDGLSESLTVRASGGRCIVLSLREESHPLEHRTAVLRMSPDRMMFSLSRNHAEYLEITLLRAYRDEMAAVNHIHLEGELAGSPYDLTILFDASRPPMSSGETAKLIGE